MGSTWAGSTSCGISSWETREYLDRAIGNFVTNTPTTMDTIREAYEKGDNETLRQVSHKLAGGALNLGVRNAGQIAQQIELAIETGSVDGAGRLVDELSVALADGGTPCWPIRRRTLDSAGTPEAAGVQLRGGG